jgi:hypothetical protein
MESPKKNYAILAHRRRLQSTIGFTIAGQFAKIIHVNRNAGVAIALQTGEWLVLRPERW